MSKQNININGEEALLMIIFCTSFRFGTRKIQQLPWEIKSQHTLIMLLRKNVGVYTTLLITIQPECLSFTEGQCFVRYSTLQKLAACLGRFAYHCFLISLVLNTSSNSVQWNASPVAFPHRAMPSPLLLWNASHIAFLPFTTRNLTFYNILLLSYKGVFYHKRYFMTFGWWKLKCHIWCITKYLLWCFS
jgi:hypothetical protein